MTTALDQLCAALDDAREMKNDFTPETVREHWPDLAQALERPTLGQLFTPKQQPQAVPDACPLERLLHGAQRIAAGETAGDVWSPGHMAALIDRATIRLGELEESAAKDLQFDTSMPVYRMLEQLVELGLWGTTIDEVAERLICDRLMQLDGYEWVDAKAARE